ncbi:MAG: hypothetical protein AB7V14_11230 [Kiritimatiellia bacterium]
MKTAAAIWVLLLGLAAGCVAPPQGIDRAVLAARRHLLETQPDASPETLRLKRVLPLDRASATNRAYLVVFEDVSSIQVSTNAGARTRSVLTYEAHVAADGAVASAGESRHVPTEKTQK